MMPELIPRARGGLAQERLELGERLLDRVQVRTVGRQVKDPGTGRGERVLDAVDLVGGEIVHDVVGRECWRQECAT